MDFNLEVSKLASKATKNDTKLSTEEATKTALVLPFIRLLGFDVFNPEEVIPEFTADIGIKKGEKVDYAILIDSKPSILFECKIVGDPLDQSKSSQLYRYFTSTEARFGVLTDGIIYKFFSDLDEKNKMDTKPFFIFDLINHTDSDLKELKKFGKEAYVEDKILSTANNLKYGRLLDTWLKEQFNSPSEDFIKLAGSNIYEGRMTMPVVEWLGGLLKDGLDRTIKSKVRDNIESVLQQEEITAQELEVQEPTPAVPDENGIITTAEEYEGHKIIQAILSEVVEPDRIFMRDAKSYCAILLDDNNRRPICRLRLDGKQMRIGTFSEKEETLNDIDKLSDIFKLASLLKKTTQEYISD